MYKTTFTITERQVGALLGPKGASLLSIERDTGAKVSVPKAGAKAPKKDETRAIVVTGPSKKCVDRAVQLCKARTAENVLDANLERLNADETTHSVAVDSRDVGALIGKDGATLRKLEQDTKTRISVSKDGAVRNVIVRGPEAHVAAATEAIADLLRCVERTVEVPGWSVGEILGRGGKALDKLQKDTEARVDISKETTGPQDFRLVRIRARTVESATAAEEAVLRIAHPLSHSVEVTSTEAGVLIGRKGETVKAIQKESGARLTIDASGNMRTVWITGPTIDNINQALNAMRDVIRDELPSERKTRTASPPRHLSGVYVSKR
jgi:rRNA processing protein Krr1/Pno1